jgi:hypothetical protein
MVALRHHLDISNTRDAAIWAVVSTAFRDCTRLGELILKSRTSFDCRKNVTRACPFKRGTAAENRRFIQFHIPWSKTTGFKGAWIFSTSSNDPVDSVSAMEHHLAINPNIPANAPLFTFETTSGWSNLTVDDVMLRCHSIWSSCKLPLPTGHGFRIGGTTFLLLCGVDPWIVIKLGRWSSKAFLLYWRKVESILSIFLPDSSPTARQVKDSLSRIASFT